MKHTTAAILRCPFCLTEAGDQGPNVGATAVWWVSCDNCGADGPSKPTRWQAVEAWNRAWRHLPARLMS